MLSLEGSYFAVAVAAVCPNVHGLCLRTLRGVAIVGHALHLKNVKKRDRQEKRLPDFWYHHFYNH